MKECLRIIFKVNFSPNFYKISQHLDKFECNCHRAVPTFSYSVSVSLSNNGVTLVLISEYSEIHCRLRNSILKEYVLYLSKVFTKKIMVVGGNFSILSPLPFLTYQLHSEISCGLKDSNSKCESCSSQVC